jgi:hypothetical protein
MSSATVTFYTEDAARLGREGAPPELRVMTGYVTQQEVGVCHDLPVLEELVIGSRGSLEYAMADALSRNGAYPLEPANSHFMRLGWDNGFTKVMRGDISQLKITVSPDTCYVVPELAPVRQNEKDTWLDTLWPVYRTITGKVGRADVDHPRDFSLAIVHQDDPIFIELARGIQDDLFNTLRTDCYGGQEFSRSKGSIERTRLLEKVFHDYRAVMFLGHYAVPGNGQQSGWQLTSDDVLTMREIENVVGVATEGAHGMQRRNAGLRPRSAEVIFAGCCRGAARDPGSMPRDKSFVYPQIFLGGGARFFIGSWMDIVWSEQSRAQDLTRLRKLPAEFFRRWTTHPREAVEHLYQAKKACGFHLVTSLYQIYTSAVEMAEAETAGPRTPIASGIAVGDRLGNVVLEHSLWRDVYGETFWSRNQDGTASMLQVLADEWQGQPELEADAVAAVQSLREAKLGNGHLVPTRAATMLWDAAKRNVLVIVYDNVEGNPADWKLLESFSSRPDQPGHIQQVMRQGIIVGQALADLHQAKISHGNLGMSNIVVMMSAGKMQIMLKDAWVHQLRMGRFLQSRYDAPDRKPGDPAEDFKRDCYGLGVVLYELATGQAPFEADEPRDRGLKRSVREVLAMKGADPTEVPEGLDIIIRDCLTPVRQARATAEWVARRLALAESGDSDFTGELHLMIQAGHRLFAVRADDVNEVQAALVSLASRPRETALSFGSGRAPLMQYVLLVVEENVGLISRTARSPATVLKPWITSAQVHELESQQARARGEPPPPPPDPMLVGMLNAQVILPEVLALCGRMEPGTQAIVLLRGGGWWEFGTAAYRVLHTIRSIGPSAPAIVAADCFFQMDRELAAAFVSMDYPRPSGSVLFERILAMRTDIDTEAAIDLATKLPPCSWREAKDALRMCEKMHGKIDIRAARFMDESRIKAFRSLDCATYTPPSRLMDPEHFGMPPHLRDVVEKWTSHCRAGSSGETGVPGPRRLLIHGAAGWGKSAFTEVLTKLCDRPLVRFDAAGCLSGTVGQSEQTMRATLSRIKDLRRVVVVLDNIDRLYIKTRAGDAGSIPETLGRIESALLHWLDNLPTGVVVIATVTKSNLLTPPWRRRMDLTLSLNPRGDSDFEYRAEVFAAVLRRHGLGKLVESDPGLTMEMARRTNPGARRAIAVKSPLARSVYGVGLPVDHVFLGSPADIQWWIQENLLLNAGGGAAPEQREFWLGLLQ